MNGPLSILHPAWLWGLLLLPLFLRGARGPRQLAAAACRIAATGLILLVLAGVQIERARPEAGTCLIAAIDVSASVGDAAVEHARVFLGNTIEALRPHDVIGSIAFATHARVVSRPDHDRTVADLLPGARTDLGGLERSATDIAAAVATAATLCPEGKQAAVLLFSDGNETQGSALAETTLTDPPMPIFSLIPAIDTLPALTMRRILAPTFAPEHAVLPLELVVENRHPVPVFGVLQLAANGTVLAREPAELPPGVSVITLPYRITGPGQYLLDATVLPVRDGEPRAESARAAITITRPLRVLLASRRPRPVVGAALAERGMQVEMVTPSALSARVSRLDEYQLVVLDDVAAADVPPEVQSPIAKWVARGGGLIATGGEHLFGDPGFVGSPLERVLPVALRSQDPTPREREPIAIYLVIDRSNSMGYAGTRPMLQNGEKMAFAKRAAIAVLDQLGPGDLVAAIAFDSQPYPLGPLQPAGETAAALAEKIRRIQYGGGTDFKEALDIARRGLVASGRAVRHVILLTDGDTNRNAEDHTDVIAGLARGGITVTTIRVGADVINLDLLEAISRATGGNFHHVEDVHALPQLMIRDAQRLMKNAPNRSEARPRINDPGWILAGITEEEIPLVGHWALTRPKRGAETRLYVDVGEQRDPLLATWQYELGRTAVVPVDFHAGASTWPAWSGFPTLWAQLAVWAAAPARPSDRHVAIERRRDGTFVRLTTVTDEPGPFLLRLPTREDVLLRPLGPRTFGATIAELPPGLRRARLVSGSDQARADEPLDLMVPTTMTSGREHRSHGPDLALLEQLARVSDGAMAPEPADVFSARPGYARETVPLEWLLVPLCLGLLLTDIALRRVS